jgi:predicted nucleic acid-binding protein
MKMPVIFDADILSTFAKTDTLLLLKKLFSKHDAYITPKIYEELSVPLDYGYSFPLKIFEQFKIIYPDEEEQKTYREFIKDNRHLGRGELEAISICIKRKYYFSSMDEVAISFAEANDVTTISLHSILRSFWESKILTKKEVQELISEIEQKDNTRIKDTQRILQ